MRPRTLMCQSASRTPKTRARSDLSFQAKPCQIQIMSRHSPTVNGGLLVPSSPPILNLMCFQLFLGCAHSARDESFNSK